MDNCLDFLNKIVTVKIDRPLGSKHPNWDMIYPVNYGYVPNSLSVDNEELDCYVLGVDKPIDSFTGRCIAVIRRKNENDDKLVVVPDNTNYSDEQIRTLTEFQEQYFESEIIRQKGDFICMMENQTMRQKKKLDEYEEIIPDGFPLMQFSGNKQELIKEIDKCIKSNKEYDTSLWDNNPNINS